MILGTSHEGESDFREWLDRKRDLDGVLVTGYATDEDLQELVRRRLPYMVMGNLDIDSAHPQERIDLVLGIKNAVLPRLCPFAGKRVAALISSALFSAARETAEGIKEALRDAGAVFDERLIMHCEGDGYQETARLLSEFKPDVVYVHGETYSGYARYFRLHQKMARPYTIVNTNGRFVAARDICDESFFCDLYSDEVIRLAVNGLFAQINRVTK
ncbi:MAG: hypothetical protein A2X49_02620 [Lentisphaerae bacterium GWF2_52_8]|nr:MAG: hypothetical protein A2X49_02620 [Lentisphaerae bacterium GWF2_52_8]